MEVEEDVATWLKTLPSNINEMNGNLNGDPLMATANIATMQTAVTTTPTTAAGLLGDDDMDNSIWENIH